MVGALPIASGIYAIRNIRNGKLWVGQTINLRKRWRQHKTDLRLGQSSPHLQAAWGEYGEPSFEFSTIELCPVEQLDFRENYWIEFHRSYDRSYGYNIERFASGTGTRSLEVRKKIGEGNKGNSCGLKGYKKWHNPESGDERLMPPESQLDRPWVRGGKSQSPEVIAKRVRANTGKKRTQVTKDRISSALEGRHLSPATISKLSEYGKGRIDIGRNIFGQIMKLGEDPTVGKSSSKIGGRVCSCLRWNINRGKPCVCGKHPPA